MSNYAKPEYSRQQVNEAGKNLREFFSDAKLTPQLLEAASAATRVIDNWRASHAFPLNTFAMTLRNRSAKVAQRRAVVSQRIKQLPSIAAKRLIGQT